MANLNFNASFYLPLLPLDLLLDPLNVTAGTQQVSYKLLDGSVLRLNGSFSGKGANLSGTVQGLQLIEGGNTVLTFSGLGVSLDELMQVAADAAPASLLEGADAIGGSRGADIIQAGGGHDLVRGQAGNDRLYGQAGNDTLEGGGGNDILLGGGGNDVLAGGPGMNRLVGGSGNDSYIVGSAQDKVIEYKNGGMDTVETSLARYTLQANVENLYATTGTNFTGTGNGLNNVIRGASGNDILNGQGGHDTISGGNGHDKIYGGAGNDHLIGDRGADLVTSVASTADVTGQPVSVSLTMPELVQANQVTVTGYVSNQVQASDTFNLAFVLDVSGSMSGGFMGEVNVGDLNNDGQSNTLLDSAIASFSQLVNSIKASGLAKSVNIALIPFDSYASIKTTGNAITDNNGNGISDLVDAARELDVAGSTNYRDALQKSIDFFGSTNEGGNFVFFLSDGAPNSYDYQAELNTLTARNGIDAAIRAISLGEGSQYATLDLLDDGLANGSAIEVTDPASLEAGLINGNFDSSSVAHVAVYKNGNLVAKVPPQDWISTPFGMRYSVTVDKLSANKQDKIEARLVFKDPSIDSIGTAQYVAVGSLNSADTLYGGAGHDTLDGGMGKDLMIGGKGHDIYRVNSLSDIVRENVGEGNDTIETEITYSLGKAANVENLSLLGSGNVNGTGNVLSNVITGNAANNILRGMAGNDTLNGGGGTDTAAYNTARQTVTVNLSNSNAIGEGNDVLVNIENIIGSKFNDIITGDVGNNRLDGGNGHDSIEGGNGDDTLVGGLGNDTLNGGNGIDTVDYQKVGQAMNVSLGYSGTATGEGSDILNSVENVIGSRFNDVIIDTGYSHNRFDGLGGNDTLRGGSGNDTLSGGAGNDVLDGGYGDDMVTYAGSKNAVVVNLQSGIANGEGVDILIDIEHVHGSDNADRIVGNNNNNVILGERGNDTLQGDAGNDTLNGGMGADVMDGGIGNDIYYVDHQRDIVRESLATGGTDTVISSINYSLKANVENLELTGVANLQGLGNTLDNKITGNSGNNRLFGNAGNDTLLGGDGDDIFNGGAGNDSIDGGNGIDTIIFDGTSAVTVDLSSSYRGLATGQGNDTLVGIENVRASNKNDVITGGYTDNAIWGLNGHDSINGGSGNDMLDGGGGNDTLIGGYGDDTLIGGAGNDSMEGGSGMDVADLSKSAAALRVNLYSGTATGQGTDSLSDIEAVVGSRFADVIAWDDDNFINITSTGLALSGMAGNDTLMGSRGNDTLDGGTGADRMIGGLGSDTYLVDNVNDVVVESGTSNWDTDTVISSIDYTLADTVENLELAGNASRGTGNASNNIITGNDNANLLNGAEGNDTLIGGNGGDELRGGAGTDTFKYLSISDSLASEMDIIRDFNRAHGDKIDLRAIDAIQTSGSSYSDSFSFIANADFWEAGQLRYETLDDGSSLVMGDADGDGVADFSIKVAGTTSLQAGDFIL